MPALDKLNTIVSQVLASKITLVEGTPVTQEVNDGSNGMELTLSWSDVKDALASFFLHVPTLTNVRSVDAESAHRTSRTVGDDGSSGSSSSGAARLSGEE